MPHIQARARTCIATHTSTQHTTTSAPSSIMAKPGSGSRPRLQGTMLPVLLLLLASIQAGPVMASEPLEPFVGVFEKLTVTVLGKIKGLEDFTKGLKWGFRIDKYRHKAEDLIGKQKQNPGPATGGTANAIRIDIVTVSVVTSSITGGTSSYPARMFIVSTADITAATPAVRTGFCTTRALFPRSTCSITLFVGGRNVAPLTGTLLECPAASTTWAATAVLGLGRGGELSRRFPRFSYTVTSDLYTLVDLSPPPPPQLPGRGISTSSTPLLRNPRYPSRYYVDVAGIRVGQKVVWTILGELGIRQSDGTGAVYLSTTNYYTVLERGVYGLLKDELVKQIRGPTPVQLGPADKDRLCYVNVGTELTVPPMAIVFGNDAVMELTGPNVWEVSSWSSSTICLAILPALNPGDASILGSRLQSGRTMTVDLTAGAGTLTFCGPRSCLHA